MADPTLSTDEELGRLASDLRLVVARLARRLRQHADAGLSPSLLSALCTIERLEPLSPGRLAAAEGVRPPTVTRILDRLERAGLIEREPDRQDRRVARIRLSPAGRRLLERSRTRRTWFLVGRLRATDQEERAVLSRAVGLLQRMVEDPGPPADPREVR